MWVVLHTSSICHQMPQASCCSTGTAPSITEVLLHRRVVRDERCIGCAGAFFAGVMECCYIRPDGLPVVDCSLVSGSKYEYHMIKKHSAATR